MTLIGYWPLNETSGDTAYDRSGQNNHGTLNGGITQGATGIIGTNAYEFDGSSNYISVSEIGSTVDETTGVTFSVWFKLNSIGGIQTLMSQDLENTAWLWEVDEESVRTAYITSGSNPRIVGDKSLSTGVWYHFVSVYDGDTLTMYVDGVEDVSTSPSASLDRHKDAHSIGYRTWNSDRYFDGRIADVRVYNHALTQEEVQYLYSVGKRGLQTTGKKSS